MSNFKIISQRKLCDAVYEMILEGDTSKITVPGQFVNIKLPEFYLRRPISVCDVQENRLTLIYKVVGKGTEKMAALADGYEFDVLCGLGNGFEVRDEKSCVLVGGGVGVPPMYLLCKRLIEKGIKPTVVMGFASKKDVFYEDEFKALGVEVKIATNDGTYGTKGFVTTILDGMDFKALYACGPMPMLKALTKYDAHCQLSLEERMGCGFGACMGCSIQTKNGYKRVCKDGPVFNKEELLWDTI
ncbi:MAG: dihydroorotate dehydrogenase electron transfer subunit [Ruminococcaceae bacterium]|nr:dihydroorotate dehydrogenase electron transfer subunit [Oscillospiraceae bacterium]